jgi:uncharacterized repeat protein (TIGR01451 family)
MNTIVIKFFLILIITYLTINPIAATTTDADWTQKEEITLEWGDSYSTGNYTVLAESFDKQAVRLMLTVYKNEKELQTAILSEGETLEVSTIKITINTISGCAGETQTPYAKTTVYTMKSPALSIDMENNITADGLENINFILKNTGGIRFTNISMEVSLPDDLIPYKDDNNKYRSSFDSVIQRQNESVLSVFLENVSVESEENTWVHVEIPALPENMEVQIHCDVLGYDLDNKPYFLSKDQNITIGPAINVTKLPLHRIVNTSESYFNMGNRVYVMIIVCNSATTDARDLTIDETIMARNFVMDPDSTLSWNIDLPARQSETFNYYLRPVRPGEVQLSTTKISREYKGQLYSKIIDSTTTKIYGPYFEISKNLDNNLAKPGDLIKVTVVAENTGNHAAYLELKDEIPDVTQLINGTLNSSGVVKPGANLSINYILKLKKTGEFRFPYAYGEYISSYYSGYAYSSRPIINVVEYTHTPAAIETIDVNHRKEDTNKSKTNDLFDISGFNLLTGLVIFIIHYLIKKYGE